MPKLIVLEMKIKKTRGSAPQLWGEGGGGANLVLHIKVNNRTMGSFKKYVFKWGGGYCKMTQNVTVGGGGGGIGI
jgi:hypothetical protein